MQLKSLLNELELTVFATGTNAARSALAVDDQLDSRFEKAELKRWANDEDFRNLPESFEKRLPLREPK